MLVFIDVDFILSPHSSLHVQNLYMFLKRQNFENYLKTLGQVGNSETTTTQNSIRLLLLSSLLCWKGSIMKIVLERLAKERQHLKNDSTALYIWVKELKA